MHKVLILGAGKIGALISGLLAESGDYDVTLGDVDSATAESVVKAHGSRNLRAVALDAGDPKALDFTATRRLAVTAERSGTPCWLVRLGGTANLSGARMRWRLASAPSLMTTLDPRAPGTPAWDAELFRARGHPPGQWAIAHEADRFHLVAPSGDRALGEKRRLSA